MFQPKSTTIAIYTLVACLVLTLLQLAVAIRSEGGTCKCVPNIWNGMLLSIENEFDLQTKRTTTSQNKMLMSYDSVNRKISMQTMGTASLTIADYKNVSTCTCRSKCDMYQILYLYSIHMYSYIQLLYFVLKICEYRQIYMYRHGI